MTGFARFEFRALGTGAVVVTTDPDALMVVLDAVNTELHAVDQSCSRFRDDSDLARLNCANGAPYPVNGDFYGALSVALRAAEVTDGDLDPTIGATLRLLGYDRNFDDIDANGAGVVTLARTASWRDIEVDEAKRTVRLPKNVQLDFGATAKAWAADRAVASGSAVGDCGVLVSLGGDIAVAGEAPDGGWIVGIADSHAVPLDAVNTSVAIASGGLATSSVTARRWRRGTREMHHIIDPETMLPATECWRTVSVAAASCVDANIASTTSIIRGERAVEWLSTLGLPARCVRTDGDVRCLNGWPLEEMPGPDSDAR